MEIVYEDNHLIAVNKPAGMLCQGDNTGDIPLTERVADFLKQRENKPGQAFCGLIHRIDRPVSGLVILAKTSKALGRMNKLFSDRQVKKTYYARVDGTFTNEYSVLKNYIVKNNKLNKSECCESSRFGAKPAQLSVHLHHSSSEYSFLIIEPDTGRPHQIRVQLSHLGFPISGDLKYGSKTKPMPHGIFLQSHSLAFEHPVKKIPVHIELASPEWWIM